MTKNNAAIRFSDTTFPYRNYQSNKALLMFYTKKSKKESINNIQSSSSGIQKQSGNIAGKSLKPNRNIQIPPTGYFIPY